MSAAFGVNLATYVVAVAFGLLAVRHWRRAGTPILAGLGLSVDRRAAIDFGVGLLITTAAMVGILVAELALGGIQAARGAFDARGAAPVGLFLLGDGFVDELLMRGMLISGLALALGGRRVAAVLVAAILFGLTHMFFKGASLESVISNGIGGVTYGLAFILTRRLWLGLGLHFAWNFAQGPLLGFPVSGHVLSDGFFRITDLGPAWLTGALYGPEGGVIGISFRFVVIGTLLAWVRMSSVHVHRPRHGGKTMN